MNLLFPDKKHEENKVAIATHKVAIGVHKLAIGRNKLAIGPAKVAIGPDKVAIASDEVAIGIIKSENVTDWLLSCLLLLYPWHLNFANNYSETGTFLTFVDNYSFFNYQAVIGYIYNYILI